MKFTDLFLFQPEFDFIYLAEIPNCNINLNCINTNTNFITENVYFVLIDEISKFFRIKYIDINDNSNYKIYTYTDISNNPLISDIYIFDKMNLPLKLKYVFEKAKDILMGFIDINNPNNNYIIAKYTDYLYNNYELLERSQILTQENGISYKNNILFPEWLKRMINLKPSFISKLREYE